MALSNETVKASYQGNGSTTTFAIPFTPIINDSLETRVYLRDETDPENITETLLIEGSLNDYTLTGAVLPSDFDSNVEMNVAPTVDQIVVITRELPLTQTLNLVTATGYFNPKTVTTALDRVVAQIQQLFEILTRVPKLSPSEQISVGGMQLPPQIVPGGLIGFNEDGTAIRFYDVADLVAEAAKDVEGIPVGGLTGDVLEKLSNTDQDADWVTYSYIGFSNRFNQAVNLPTLRDTLDYVIDITYTAPLISLSASGNSLREKGDAVTSTTLTASITRRSDPIAQVRFYQNPSTLLDTQSSGGGIPNGGSSTYAWTGSFSDTTTFRAEVDDDGTSGGPTTVTSTTTFNFVYPYYVGAGAANLAASSVAALTKRIINSTASRQETITAGAGEVFYFAYPASYGALTSILDVNNFQTFPDWTLRTENITGLDGNPVSYRIYEFNNPVSAGSYQYTFVR